MTGTLGQFGQTFAGDGTYYGDKGGAGHCSFQFGGGASLEWAHGTKWFAAINNPQYGQAAMCGMCIKFRWVSHAAAAPAPITWAPRGGHQHRGCTALPRRQCDAWTSARAIFNLRRGTGAGLGHDTISSAWQYAQISDECPECRHGDVGASRRPAVIGLLMQDQFLPRPTPPRHKATSSHPPPRADMAAFGDGRWKIEWQPVQCNVGSGTFVYAFQGSHAHYSKMQVLNSRVPVASVQIMAGGSFQPMVSARSAPGAPPPHPHPTYSTPAPWTRA